MQDVAAVVTGIDSMAILQQDLKIAREFKPLEKGELDSLLKRVRPQAATAVTSGSNPRSTSTARTIASNTSSNR